jgi:hypothetical protein
MQISLRGPSETPAQSVHACTPAEFRPFGILICASFITLNILTEVSTVEQSVEGLTDYQQAYLRRYPSPQLFAVISWGCAATAWLAAILNRHPDIYCVHEANLSWHVLGNCPRLDGVPYLRIIGSQGHACIAAGEVHGVSRHLVPECRRTWGDKFNAAVVVREPIPRLQSQLALYQEFEGLQVWDIHYLDGILSRTGIVLAPGDYPSRLFVHAANMLNAILDEREVGKIYRSEDLTSNGQALGEFVEEITRGKVSPASAWLEDIIQTGKVNSHAGRNPRRELDDWQIDVIRKVVDPRAWEMYEALGYTRPDFAAGSLGMRQVVSG